MAPRLIVGETACLWAHDPAGGVWLLSGYCSAFVNLIKARIYWRDRAWSREAGAWWIADSWAEWALDCAELLYVRFEKRELRELFFPLPESPRALGVRLQNEVDNGPIPQTEAWAWRTLWLRKGAPQELVKAAWRELAKVNHPDRNPDGATAMIEVNQAADIIEAAMRNRGEWKG